MNIDNTMKELAEYIRLQEETSSIIESIKDQLKQYMLDNKLDTITGIEHRANYKTVNTSRIDTIALKKDLPDIARQYTRSTETKRFTFA